MPVSVCEFTVYVCVCVYIEVGAREGEHRPSGLGYGPVIVDIT